MILLTLRMIFFMTAIVSQLSAVSSLNSPKVIVIGGGIAGLTTAYRLQQEGMNTHLYEARGRVGGRILTAKINGHIAELGAQSITDGGEAIHLNRLIDEFGLQRASSRVYLQYAYFNGMNVIPINDILKNRSMDPDPLKKKLEELSLTSSNMQEVLEHIVNPQEYLYKTLAVRMAAYEGGTIDRLSPLYTETLFHMLLGGLCSAHQGSDETHSYVDLVTIEGGNLLLPQKMREALGTKLHLNMPLVKVSKKENGSFELTFKNNMKVEADILVLAIPCSVYEDIDFEEGIIPSSKLEAIYKVNYGSNAKIMVPFTTPPLTRTSLVNDKIVSYFDRAQLILTLYHTGEGSLFSPETIAHSYIQSRKMLEHGFENCPSFATPLYAKDEAYLSYEGPIGYSWPNDPYAKGSYSYIASGQENVFTSTVDKNGETFKALFSPLNKNLYFAGEHTSILFDVPGTMEAACESGERIARTILKNKAGSNKTSKSN
jgi:monoamine oxidase